MEKHILIADKDGLHSTLLQSYLKDNSRIIAVCNDQEDIGKALLNKLIMTKFDLIISDGRILEDIDFTIWLNHSPQYAKVPVIFLLPLSSDVLRFTELIRNNPHYTLIWTPTLQDENNCKITLKLKEINNLVNVLLMATAKANRLI